VSEVTGRGDQHGNRQQRVYWLQGLGWLHDGGAWIAPDGERFKTLREACAAQARRAILNT
jgi:hypothetical protein